LGRARPFSLRLQSVLATLPLEGFASARVQCPASAPFQQFASSVQLFSFSASGFESSRRSEIDPEDSPKSLPELDSSAHRRSKHQCTQRRELLRTNASGKSSALSREGQIDSPFRICFAWDKKNASGLNFHPKRRRFIGAHAWLLCFL